jgi:hypothetical protein
MCLHSQHRWHPKTLYGKCDLNNKESNIKFMEHDADQTFEKNTQNKKKCESIDI